MTRPNGRWRCLRRWATLAGPLMRRGHLAFALFQMGRLDEAKAVIEQALAALRTCGKAYQVASCLDIQASIVMDRGDVPAARELYAQALAAFKAIGNEAATAAVLGNLAVLEFAEGHPELALQAASEALEIHARGKNAIHLAVGHANMRCVPDRAWRPQRSPRLRARGIAFGPASTR